MRLVAGGWWLVAAAMMLAGCGDDDATPGDAGDGDVPGETEGGADADADADAEDDGGTEADVPADVPEDVVTDGEDGDGGTPWTRTLVVLTSDYVSGGIALVDLDTLDGAPVVVSDAATAHADAVLVCRGGGVFDVVERFGSDAIRRFEASGGAVTESASFDLPDGGNPQDAFATSTGELAVPLYESTSLAFVAGDLSAAAGTVDLAAFADAADGLPETYRAVEAGGRLFVSLQLLDRTGTFWTPTGPGVLVALDPATHALIDLDATTAGVQVVTLSGSNPWGPMRVYGPAVLVSSVGEYGVDDGGIEAVDPATGTTRGFVVGEAALGGDLGDWIVREDDRGFALVTAAFSSDLLVEFDLDTGATVGEPLLSTGGYTLSGLVDLADGRIAVGDRTTVAAGIRVFDAETGVEVTTAPLGVGLPPVAACLASP